MTIVFRLPSILNSWGWVPKLDMVNPQKGTSEPSGWLGEDRDKVGIFVALIVSEIELRPE